MDKRWACCDYMVYVVALIVSCKGEFRLGLELEEPKTQIELGAKKKVDPMGWHYSR